MWMRSIGKGGIEVNGVIIQKQDIELKYNDMSGAIASDTRSSTRAGSAPRRESWERESRRTMGREWARPRDMKGYVCMYISK